MVAGLVHEVRRAGLRRHAIAVILVRRAAAAGRGLTNPQEEPDAPRRLHYRSGARVGVIAGNESSTRAPIPRRQRPGAASSGRQAMPCSAARRAPHRTSCLARPPGCSRRSWTGDRASVGMNYHEHLKEMKTPVP